VFNVVVVTHCVVISLWENLIDHCDLYVAVCVSVVVVSENCIVGVTLEVLG